MPFNFFYGYILVYCSMGKMIRVLIAEDHIVVRTGLHLLLNNHSDMEVIGEAGTGKEAIEKVKKLGPDVLLYSYN